MMWSVRSCVILFENLCLNAIQGLIILRGWRVLGSNHMSCLFVSICKEDPGLCSWLGVHRRPLHKGKGSLHFADARSIRVRIRIRTPQLEPFRDPKQGRSAKIG